MQFYKVSNDTFSRRGFPWVAHILSGVTSYTCKTCGRLIETEYGDLEVTLETKKGTKWPDVLGIIGGLFIVSGKALDAWRKEGVGDFPVHRIHILGPHPMKLRDLMPPKYFWLNAKKMKGALLDFKASGFVDAKKCSECGSLIYNVSATYDHQHTYLCPYAIIPESWNGANLFTTNLSDGLFFCTEAVLECARKYKLTNFRFIPVEQGDGYWTEPVKYM